MWTVQRPHGKQLGMEDHRPPPRSTSKPPDEVATLGALAKLPHLARTTVTTPGEPIRLSLSSGVSLDVRFRDDTVNRGNWLLCRPHPMPYSLQALKHKAKHPQQRLRACAELAWPCPMSVYRNQNFPIQTWHKDCTNGLDINLSQKLVRHRSDLIHLPRTHGKGFCHDERNKWILCKSNNCFTSSCHSLGKPVELWHVQVGYIEQSLGIQNSTWHSFKGLSLIRWKLEMHPWCAGGINSAKLRKPKKAGDTHSKVWVW